MNQAQLEALTSAGLVKRASKALDKSTFKWMNESDKKAFVFENEQGEINIETLESSQCSCTAPGICKHIVAGALIIIREGENEKSSKVPFSSELNDHDLFAQASKASVRFAFNQFDKYEALVTSYDSYIEISWSDKKAILGSGVGLNAIVVDGHNEDKFKLLAALLYKKHQNTAVIWPTWLQEEETERLSDEDKQQTMLKEQLADQVVHLASLGISKLNTTHLTRLRSLSPQLRAARLYGLSNHIIALCNLIETQEQQRELDPLQGIYSSLARLYARIYSCNIQNIQEKSELSNLDLLCLGGHGWVARNGAQGVTMVFISQNGQIFTATLARNSSDRSFSIDKALEQQLWSGLPNLKSLPNYSLRLANAKFNTDHRLSLSQETLGKKIAFNHFDFKKKAISDFELLKDIPVYQYGIVHVNKWLSVDFDETDQRLVLIIEDTKDNKLFLSVEYSKQTAARITNLLDIDGRQVDFILVKHNEINGHHQFEPISLMIEKWQSLDFEAPDKKKFGLLERLIRKLKTKDNSQINKHDFLQTLLNAREQLVQYPEVQQVDEMAIYFEELGLSDLSRLINLAHKSTSNFLKLAYVLDLYIWHSGSWPIYPKQ